VTDELTEALEREAAQEAGEYRAPDPLTQRELELSKKEAEVAEFLQKQKAAELEARETEVNQFWDALRAKADHFNPAEVIREKGVDAALEAQGGVQLAQDFEAEQRAAELDELLQAPERRSQDLGERMAAEARIRESVDSYAKWLESRPQKADLDKRLAEAEKEYQDARRAIKRDDYELWEDKAAAQNRLEAAMQNLGMIGEEAERVGGQRQAANLLREYEEEVLWRRP
jgi:hypothetical protein